MESQSERNLESNPAKADAHIISAQQILKALQEKISAILRETEFFNNHACLHQLTSGLRVTRQSMN